MIDFDVKVNCYGFVNKILISASRLFVNKTIRITKNSIHRVINYLNTISIQMISYKTNIQNTYFCFLISIIEAKLSSVINLFYSIK